MTNANISQIGAAPCFARHPMPPDGQNVGGTEWMYDVKAHGLTFAGFYTLDANGVASGVF